MSINVKDTESLREAISTLRTQETPEKEIVVRKGQYFLDESIDLGHQDGGLKIKGEDGVEFIGGKRLKNWRVVNSREWRCDLPIVKGNPYSDFRMLMINDRFAERARYPETGFLIHESVFDVEWKSTFEGGFTRTPSEKELMTLQFKSEDISPDFVVENAELTIFHMWDESLVGVKSIDHNSRTIRFSNKPGWPPGAFASNYKFEKRYVIWNTKEGMLRPGQWYIDRKNKEVVYWPQQEESIQHLQVIAPIIENIIRIDGSETHKAENIHLQNITLMVTNAPLMSGAFGAKRFDGAISATNTFNCSFTDLEVRNVGAHCLKTLGDRLKIENCVFHHCGAGAIRHMGSQSLIRNNYIHDVGKTFPSAIALYVGATDPNDQTEWLPQEKSFFDNTIEHNEIHDVPYAAICAGGRNLKIVKNLIYRAMQDLYDGAGIYVTFCNNALIKNNFIRDIKNAPGAGTSAYYLDEKTIDAIVEENLEINVPRPSHNHISKRNLFRNNYFIIEEYGWFSIERSEDYRFENNVIVAPNGFSFYDLKFCRSFRNNIIYTPSGKLTTKELNKYEILREFPLDLTDQNENVDPKIQSFRNGIISLAADSPIREKGIKAIDVSDAGRVETKKNPTSI